MLSIRKLGSSTPVNMFKKAMAGKFAIPAYNFNNMEQLQAIIQGCVGPESPVHPPGLLGRAQVRQPDPAALHGAGRGGDDQGRQAAPLQFALHLDHGDTFELCKSCIESGFSSVMIDGSHHPYEKNVELTRKVVEYAHEYDVTVEGELGVLAGIEDDVVAAKSNYTQPDEVEDFVKKTGVDSLAISIGTSHGAYKFKPEQCTRNAEGVLEPPPLRFDILEEIEKRIPGFPIVLHGASSVVLKYVDMINQYGGKMERRGRHPRGPAAQGRRARRSARSTSTPTAAWP